jgi:hypothetical protein
VRTTPVAIISDVGLNVKEISSFSLPDADGDLSMVCTNSLSNVSSAKLCCVILPIMLQNSERSYDWHGS